MRMIGIAGLSGSGKTTLLCSVVPYMIQNGLQVSTIKHAHHQFDIDSPGKDSYLHRQAGATQVLVASDRRWALMHENRDCPPATLGDLITKMDSVDLLIVEGFKKIAFPKMLVHRYQAHGTLTADSLRPFHHLAGIISDAPINQLGPAVNMGLSIIPLKDTSAIATELYEKALPIHSFLTQRDE